jgi:uncharacterized membrane protein YeaQ/YmgE (transglycosylase-associated protein family)
LIWRGVGRMLAWHAGCVSGPLAAGMGVGGAWGMGPHATERCARNGGPDTLESIMGYVWMAIVGFVVGLLARAVLPGDQKLGMVLTAALGIAGSFLANLAGQALGFYKGGDTAGLLASVLGAVVLLVLYGVLIRGKVDGDSGAA